MAAGEGTVGDDLASLFERPDLAALDAWLSAADDAQLRQAMAWKRAHRTAIEELRPGEAWEVHRARTWSVTLLVAASAPPAEAAKTLPWNDWWYVRDDERDLLARALLRRPRAWAERFVPAATEVKLGRRRESATAPFLFGLLDPLIRRHDLPVPGGEAFLSGWARSGPSDDDPYLEPLLPALLRSSHLRHRGDVPVAVEAAIASGEIERELVVEAALEALVVDTQPSAQRVLADLLARLCLTAEDLTGRLPLLQSALATAHGSVTEVLLPLAVSVATEAEDIDQIARVIAGRSEKRQRLVLLELLHDADVRDRIGVEAIVGALGHLDACDDAALRERVARFRRALADAPDAAADPSPPYEGLWAPLARRPTPAAEALEVPAELDRAGCRRLLGSEPSPEYAAAHGHVNRTGHSVLLEHLVRVAAVDRGSLLERLPAHDSGMWPMSPVPAAIRCWLRGDLDDGPVYDAQIPGLFRGPAPSWRPREQIVNAAAREVLWRASRVPVVLSTPSHADGTLHLDALLRRIEDGSVPSYTPHDLAQALLRLPPVSREDVALVRELGELALPADPVCWAEHARLRGRPDEQPVDGVELLRRWVDDGGVRPLDARWHLLDGVSPYGLGWDWGDAPPLPAGVLDSLLVDVAALADSTSTPAAVTLAPCWADLAASSLGSEHRTDVHADVVLDSPGPLGTPSHALVLAPLAGPPEDQRRAVLALLELVRRGALSAPHARCAVEVLNHAGRLSLPRVAQGLEQAFVAGGLADLWTVAVGITVDAVRRKPLPSGLPDLLRLLAAYLPVVPDRDLPVELIELAAAGGRTKSHAEARALLSVRDSS